jgi:predicted O-methyltransferase YrrM
MTDRLAVIVPTRGRPDNIRKVLAAWDFTGAWADADLILAVDADDPYLFEYQEPEISDRVFLIISPEWQPMVPKLNLTAMATAVGNRSYSAIAFAGDDHLPRTIGWARRYLDVLRELGSGMVYGDDGYQGANLATEWAVTADCVRALGRMVPAPVDHLYCDNAMMDLFGQAGALRHLPEIRIEHMNPWCGGKAEKDEQYERVNSKKQYATDGAKYQNWKRAPHGLLHEQIPMIKALRVGRPEVGLDGRVPAPARQKRQRSERMRGSGPRRLERSGPSRFSAPPKSKFPFPPEFRQVIGATPDEIAFTLADMAKQVPSDQEIVELGVYQGRTALIMAWGASQGNGAHVTAVDAWDLPGNTYAPPFTDPVTRERAYANIENLGYSERVKLYQDFAVKFAGDWIESPTEGGMPVGLLFVDDDHSYEGARAAIEAWAPHLADGAVIAVDDYGHPDWPGVAEAVDELVDNGVLEPIEIYHDRLAVTRLVSANGNESPEMSVKASITAITNEGVDPAPVLTDPMEHEDGAPCSDPWCADKGADVSRETVIGLDLDDLPLSELRTLGKEHGVSHAGVMGAPKLIEALRSKGL